MATAPRLAGDGSIHEVSLLIGELIGKVEHLSSNVRTQAENAEQQRIHTHQKIDQLREVVSDVRTNVQKVSDTVCGVQQDLAEMKNDAAVIASRVDDFRQKENQIVGGWEVLRRVGTGTKVLLGVIITGAFVIFVQFILPRLL